MDRTALAERNQALAALRHRTTWRASLRRLLLEFYAKLPSPTVRSPEKNLFLIIRPDHVGDMLLTMPAVQALSHAVPDARLVGLVGPWSADVMAAYPEIDLVLTVLFPGFTRGAAKGGLLTSYRLLWQWAGKIRHLRAETALIMRPDHGWGAWLAYLAGIPRRVGYDLPNVRPFLTERLPYTSQHATLQCIELIKPWTGALDPFAVKSAYPITDLDRAELAELLAAQGRSDRPLVVIHPGAGTPIKYWPPEHWASVADRLAERLQAVVVFTGTDREHKQVWQIMDLMRQRAISLAGETNIGQLAALYERALVVIGPDTGPLHLAVASGAPTVHLFGPADPALFGPWGNPARQRLVTSAIACRPCRILDWAGDDPAYHPCIRDIAPQQVFEAALAAASQKSSPRAP